MITATRLAPGTSPGLSRGDGDPAHRIARDHKAWLRDYLAELAACAGHPDPTTLAARLLTLHEGAIVLYSAGADPGAADTARGAAAALLVPTELTVTRPRR